MRSSKLIKLAIPLALAAAVLVPAAALATSSSIQPISCSVTSDGGLTVSGSQITGRVLVAGGNPQCQGTVTITSWTAPNGSDGKPYSEQTLFSHTTQTFGPGNHTISTELPDCFYQVDLLRGDQATAPDGGSVYPAGLLINSLNAGSRSCVQPSPTPTPPPVSNVTPAPSPSNSPSVLGASTQPPGQLPDTGAALGSMVGVGSMVGAGYAYIRSRRSFRRKQ